MILRAQKTISSLCYPIRILTLGGYRGGKHGVYSYVITRLMNHMPTDQGFLCLLFDTHILLWNIIFLLLDILIS